MSQFETNAVIAHGPLYEFLAQALTYTRLDGSEVTIRPVHDPMEGFMDEKDPVAFHIRKSEVAVPQEGERVTFNGRTFTILRVSDMGDGTHRCTLTAPKLT